MSVLHLPLSSFSQKKNFHIKCLICLCAFLQEAGRHTKMLHRKSNGFFGFCFIFVKIDHAVMLTANHKYFKSYSEQCGFRVFFFFFCFTHVIHSLFKANLKNSSETRWVGSKMIRDHLFHQCSFWQSKFHGLSRKSVPVLSYS